MKRLLSQVSKNSKKKNLRSEGAEKDFISDIRSSKKQFSIYFEKQRDRDNTGYWFIGKLKKPRRPKISVSFLFCVSKGKDQV